MNTFALKGKVFKEKMSFDKGELNFNFYLDAINYLKKMDQIKVLTNLLFEEKKNFPIYFKAYFGI